MNSKAFGFFVMICVKMTINLTCCSSINDTNTLYGDLLKDYNKNIRGLTNQTLATELFVRFFITSIIGFDEVTGTFSVAGYLDIYWIDERMTWNASSYNGLSYVAMPQRDVWKPTLILANGNGASGLVNLGQDWMLVRYNPDGTALWSPGGRYQVYCGPDMKDYPYDTQECSMNFMPVGYASSEIKFSLLDDKYTTQLFLPNGAWDLKSTSLSVTVHSVQVQVLSVSFTLTRRATFVLVNMILPLVALGVLNLLVFLLPPQAGERVGYSISLLLAICVFLTIAFDNLPKSSFPSFSVLCVKLLVDMTISSFVVLFTVVGLRFYHKDDKQHISPCVASWTSCILCRRCRRYKIKREEETHRKNAVKSQSSHVEEFYTNRIEDEGERDVDDEKADEIPPVTWTDVGVASDIVFFFVTFCAFTASHLVYYIYINSS